jgi:hypothetical protein
VEVAAVEDAPVGAIGQAIQGNRSALHVLEETSRRCGMEVSSKANPGERSHCSHREQPALAHPPPTSPRAPLLPKLNCYAKVT